MPTSTPPPRSPSPPAPAPAPLLSVRNLSVHYPVRNAHTWPWQARQTLHAVNGISLDIHPGETLGIVGESGCGKSTLGRALVNLTPTSAGSIRWHGQEMAHAPQAAWLPLRRQVQMVFQDPLASLDPRMTVAQIIAEPLRTHHRGMPHSTIDHKVRTTLQRVGLSESHLNRYPHEFSGGQCQRIGIARALILEPELIICDEPVSALDVSIQAQIINLLTSLQNQLGLALLFIAHDLAVVRHISHRVMVMYLGRTMELAPTRHLYQHPRHPYTQALLSAIPIADPVRERHKTIQLLEGDLPSPLHPPSGCVFRTRCPQAQADCAHTIPPLLATHHNASANPNAFAACIHLKADNAIAS